MEVLSAIVDKVIGVVWDQGIKKQVTYIFCYNKNFNGLNEGVKRLGDVKERLDRERDQARRKGHIVELRVEEWFREVGEFETQVENYKSNVGHKKTGGFYYLLPYYRHQLGRKAKKMEMEALKLRDESPKLDEVSHAKMISSYDHTSSNLGYIEFDSRKSVMRDIMTKLEDPTVKIIGLHGPRGMGKSTLIKEISNKAQHEKLFDKVAVIDVTKNPNPRKIQEEIAHVLENPLQGESEYVRADYLRRWLKIENVSILIILDHLYERLDLNKLGIPVDDDYDLRKKNELSGKPTEDKGGSADHPKGTSEKVIKENADHPKGTNEKVIKENFLGVCKGCKILLSSHDETVFPDDVKSKFCLSKLDDNDALILFQKKVGGGNIMHVPKEEIKNYCEEIKINCAGLPTEIVSLADAFQKWSESVSEATLDKFKKQGLVEWQKSREIPPLKNEELKSIYLLCAQRGHLPLFMNLVKYCFGLSIFEGVSSLSVVREKINKSIQQQKHLSMFHTVGDDDLTSAHNHHNIFILRDGKLDDWPELQKCTYISICNTDIIDGLPQVINCPRLKFFQIDTHDPSLKIPENFFRGMKNLKVLILSGFHLPRLPASIKHLLKLRMLSLERCTLKDNLGIIGELKKLRILSFSGSQLQNVPAGLRCLDKLQLLDISDCFIEEITILPDLLSSLMHLEELYIRKMLVGRETNQDQNSFLYELKNLHQLKVVDLSIPCVSVLPNHLFFNRLKDYKIMVGDYEMFSVGKFRMPNKYEELRVLVLQLKDDTNIHSQTSIKLLFKTVQSLLLGKLSVENVVNDLNVDGFPDLKHLSIINNNNIKYVNSTKFSNSVDIFPNLECLSFYNLRNLEMICYGPITVASFSKLKTIKVEMCNRLENLFPFYTLKFPISGQTCEISECNSYMDKFLADLEIIEVVGCGSLNTIFQIPMNYDKVEFLKLHTLTLQSLPSFTYFYTEVERSCKPHLIEAQITNRDQTNITTEEDEHSEKTYPLFGEKVKIPNLENLNLSSLSIHKIWNDQNSSSFYFQNLIKLVVKDCDKLTYLCSLSVASSLKKLKSLVISECSIMEKIFETEGISVDKVCVLPKLEEIHLSKMDSLTNIWQNKVSVDSFYSLISVNIEKCNQLDKIFPSHMDGWVESLVKLKVSNCNCVKEIFEINESQEIDASSGIDTNLQVIVLEDLPNLKQLWSKDPDGILNFKKLRTIEVCKCSKLSNLFPTSVAKDVSNLERMSALECEKMVEIVTSNDASKANSDPLVFPKLTYVRLYGLPSIKHFYKGRHPIKCPQLKELSMDKSVKLKTFHKETDETTTEEEFVFSAEAVFPNLEYLEIDFMEAQNLLPKYQMHRLKELIILNSVHNRDLLYPFLYGMPNLEKLKLTSSYSQTFEPRADIRPQEKVGTVLELKQLFVCFSKIEDLGFEGDQVLQRLELLRLKGCHKLRNLGPSSVSLTYLTCLKLKYCSGLRNVMASSTAKSMVQLETMKVIECEKVEEIVSKEGSEEGKMMKIKFNKLTTIELVGLENMRSFSSNKECEFEFPSLEIVVVRECLKMEKFSERRPIAPKLKNIFGVKGDENAKWQWEGDLNASIDKVFNEKVTFTYSEALSLDNSSEFIIERLWHGSHSVQHNSFGYLKRLTAYGCDTLEHVIPSHLLSCFQNLEELQVRYCKAARVIFNINDENRMTKASGIFRLKRLSFGDLPKLEHIWDKDPEGVIGLQMLKEMRVEDCKHLESLFPASVAKDLTRLQVLDVRKCKELAEIFRQDKEGEEGEGTTQDSLFPRLTTLTPLQLPRLNYSLHSSKQQESISNMSWRDSPLQELCLGSWPIPNSCFDLLDSLILDGCHFLSDVLLPFNLLLFLTHLKTLEVQNCNSVNAIFGVKCTTQDRDVISLGPSLPFSLKKLIVSKLPNLKNVWNEDPHEILSMHHLREVNVKECKRLTSVFPTSVAKTIEELENLVVEDCERLMNIVAEYNMDPRETNQELTLPCPYVRSLKLQTLPKFKYFYYYSLRCDIFTHLEYIEECLALGGNGVEMILRGEFQRNLLHNLKALTLCFRLDVFGYEILEQVPNIEKLVVCDGSFKEMFCCKSPNDVDYSGLLLHLKLLHLESLGELVSIGLENSWTEPFVRNLETFEVIRCSSLKNLVASTVSFSSLTCLKVERCHNLSYLLTSSTVKSLGELKRMEILWCSSIEEIVSKEEKESDEDEIIFPKLNCLNLHGLWKLRRFYRGSLSFPSLEELSVTDCEEMITLCPGTIEAGKLSQVKLGFWKTIPLEIDLNYTMRKKFLREISKLKQLELKSRPLHEIWHGSLRDFCFSELDTLIVEDCQFLSDAVLSFHLLSLLPKLETLKVRNCDSVKTIFDVKCTAQDTPINFPLKKLVLSKLPKLEIVWNEGPRRILSMHNLEEVFVDRCKCLKSVFPASIVKDLVELEYLEVKDCEGLMAIVAEECHDEDEEIIFERLQVLDLERLEELRCFYAGKFTLSFPSLNEVHVIKCSSMKTFSGDNKIDHLIKWYYSEYKRSREESDLNSAVRRTFEKEVMIT